VNGHVFTGNAWVAVSTTPPPPPETPPSTPTVKGTGDYDGLEWNGKKWIDPAVGAPTPRHSMSLVRYIALIAVALVVLFVGLFMVSPNIRTLVWDTCAQIQPLNAALHCSTRYMHEIYGTKAGPG
jgi:hypothetical protein